MNHSDQTEKIRLQTEKMLIDQYERFYRLAYSYVHNKADALDVVQESACKAIVQCKKLKDTEKLLPWLCRIVVNTSLDLLRNQIKEQPAEELPEAAAEDKYEELDLKKALNRLEPENRTVIILRYFEDMKIEDIALVVDENINTVKARLYRSLKKLRIQLDDTAALKRKETILMKKQDRNSGYFDNFDNFDKLESLKQEYNEIPVPDAAKARILAGISNGKRNRIYQDIYH